MMKIKKNIKLILGIILSMILVSGISVYATYNYFATDVIYIRNGHEMSVEEALNELYENKKETTEETKEITTNGEQILDKYYKKLNVNILSDKKYTENEYKSYGELQYNKGAGDNGGLIIKNFELKSGYNHYELGFEPSFVYMELDNSYILYGKKGDKKQYYIVNSKAGSNDNKFDTDGTGYWMNNNDGTLTGTVYIVK